MARFLVVDDDVSSVHAMSQLLRDDGHEVSAFTGGAEAVAALAEMPFDAIVTDLHMGHVDGRQVVRAARQHSPNACVVVVSAYGEARALIDEGVCVAYEKPIDYGALVGAIEECLAARGSRVGGVCPMRVDSSGEAQPRWHPFVLRPMAWRAGVVPPSRAR
jgi:DNA-binding NtrC family response regulator